MTTDERRDLLEDFLLLPETERQGLLARMDFAQLSALVEMFTEELNGEIKSLPKKPTTARAKKSIARLELYDETDN